MTAANVSAALALIAAVFWFAAAWYSLHGYAGGWGGPTEKERRNTRLSFLANALGALAAAGAAIFQTIANLAG